MEMMNRLFALTFFAVLAASVCAGGQQAQQNPPTAQAKPPAGQAKPAAPPVAPPVIPQGLPPPPGYVIGADDVLVVTFWRDRDLSGEVTVRPDGKISLPLVNDIDAVGLTPEQLRDKVTEAARQFVEDPNVTVVVRTINSRRVFVTGQVARPGPYPLTSTMTVLQAIAVSGGLSDFAKQKSISVVRTEGRVTTRFRFNYKDVLNGKNLRQNIELKPGDTIIVP